MSEQSNLKVSVTLDNVRDKPKTLHGVMYVIAEEIGCNKCFTFSVRKRGNRIILFKDGKPFSETEGDNQDKESWLALPEPQKVVQLLFLGALNRYFKNKSSQGPVTLPEYEKSQLIKALTEACS